GRSLAEELHAFNLDVLEFYPSNGREAEQNAKEFLSWTRFLRDLGILYSGGTKSLYLSLSHSYCPKVSFIGSLCLLNPVQLNAIHVELARLQEIYYLATREALDDSAKQKHARLRMHLEWIDQVTSLMP